MALPSWAVALKTFPTDWFIFQERGPPTTGQVLKSHVFFILQYKVAQEFPIREMMKKVFFPN